jgi:ABC-2 family transporter protein
MSSPEVIYACRMLMASSVVILFCLSVGIEKGQPLRASDDVGYDIGHPKSEKPSLPQKGHVTVAFGAWRIELFRDGQQEVHFILLLLAEWVAGAGGTLLALIWTAGFMPEFLQPANASVLVSKPISRWVLLLGKYLGVLTFVAFQVTVFILGTYLALGLRTGYWPTSYLWGIPLLLLHFAAMYSFSVLLAVVTRSTLTCVIGSVLFWFLCLGMNYSRHRLLALESEMPPVHPFLRGCMEAGYWILPKPVDLVMVMYRALGARDFFGTLPELEKVQALGVFYPELSLWTALFFAIGMIGIAARQLADTDY